MKYIESESIELKLEIKDSLKKEIVALLNTKGGKIYIGIDDTTKDIKNLTDKEKDINLSKISNWIADGVFYPDVSKFIHFEYNADGLLEIDIKEGKLKPYYLTEHGLKPSGCYKRIGPNTYQMNQEEIRLVALESNGIRFEDQISDNQDLTFKRFMDRVDEKKVDFNEDKFNTFGFKNSSGQFTNLALLFSDQNPIVVKLAVYNGNIRYEFKIKKEFEGSLAKMIDVLIDYCDVCNDKRVIKPEDSWQRIEILSYPKKALREAILNCIEHSNYFFLSNIKVEFFDDRVEISNPGNFYGGITLEQALHGAQSFRNPKLVYALDKLDFIENYSTGLVTIFKEYEGFEKQPKIDISSTHTTVILYNRNYEYYQENRHVANDVADDIENGNVNGSVNGSVTLNNIQLQIVDAVRKNKNATIKELAAALSKGDRTIARNIKLLKDEGILVRIGSDKTGYWEVKEK